MMPKMRPTLAECCLVIALSTGGCATVDDVSDLEQAAVGEAESSETEADLSAAESPAFDALLALNSEQSGYCSGKPGRKRGRSNERVSVGLLQSRTFVYYAPKNLDPNEPAPLVIVPHGFAMSGDEMYRISGYKELADREKFVAVFPDGGGVNPWNVGRGVNGWGAGVAASHDDQSFIDAIIKFAEADQCIDRAHMFVSGFSMGGYFSNEVGCLRSDIAAVGPHSGGSHDLKVCPGKVKPVIIFHGDADWLIYYSNGIETRDRWLKRNGCSARSDNVRVKNGTCEYYRDCAPGGQVALCHFNGLGHAWAGGRGSLFADPDFESASELGWEFFKKYAW
jgi:polyhydroxybutyrate depolymerase